MKSLRRWCLRDAGDIACRSWNDEFVVYCDSQAATHLLGPVGGAVLAALRTRDEPQTIAEISIRAFGDDSSHILHERLPTLCKMRYASSSASAWSITSRLDRRRLSPRLLRRSLLKRGLRLRTGPVVTNIRSRLEAVAQGIAFHYSAHRVEAESAFADFHISIERPLSVRRWVQPQALFRFDADLPFAPLPASQAAVPMLEWGLNWCISSQ